MKSGEFVYIKGKEGREIKLCGGNTKDSVPIGGLFAPSQKKAIDGFVHGIERREKLLLRHMNQFNKRKKE